MAEPIRMIPAQIREAGGGRVDPANPVPAYRPVPDVQAIRERLRMSQDTFARTIGVPVATLRNWEQRRTGFAPAARTLLRILEREPDAALRALAG